MKLRALVLFSAAALLAGCATTPEEDPVQTRLNGLDERVDRIDRIVSNQSLMQMAQRVDSQQEELRVLRGRLEELQNDNAVLRREQRDLYADLDKRLTTTAAAASAAAAAVVPPTMAGDEQSLYDRAFTQLSERQYAAAVESFRSLATSFPNGQLADNTQYWLGEAYYVTQEYDHAAAAFQRVLANWPNSRKAPDALLKLGYTQLAQRKDEAGRASLREVVERFPGTDPARLATERLASLSR